MGNRARQLAWLEHVDPAQHRQTRGWTLTSDSKILHIPLSDYEPPFGLSPLMRRILVSLGLIDGYIEGLDEFLAIQEDETLSRTLPTH